MIEPNIIKKIQRFADDRRNIGYRSESPSGINPSLIIFGEKHADLTEKDQEDFIKELGLTNYVLLAEHKFYFENNWKEKHGCENVLLCDLQQKDKKQKELLGSHLTPHELKELNIPSGLGVDTDFERGADKYPYIMKLFYDAREKEMGKIICSNYSKDSPKPLVVIIGHYHARKDSEVHKILDKEKIFNICMWNEKVVKEIKEKYHFFRQN